MKMHEIKKKERKKKNPQVSKSPRTNLQTYIFQSHKLSGEIKKTNNFLSLLTHSEFRDTRQKTQDLSCTLLIGYILHTTNYKLDTHSRYRKIRQSRIHWQKYHTIRTWIDYGLIFYPNFSIPFIFTAHIFPHFFISTLLKTGKRLAIQLPTADIKTKTTCGMHIYVKKIIAEEYILQSRHSTV